MTLRQLFRTCLPLLRGLLIAMGVGAAITGVYAMERVGWAFGLMLATGALVGAFIFVAISLLQLVLRPLVLRLPARAQVFGETVVLLIGGTVGWATGLVATGPLHGRRVPWSMAFSAPMRVFLIVSALLAVATGLIVRSFELMKARLRAREAAEKELEIARAIQLRLLPPPEILGVGYRVSARNSAARYVAGDFYDVLPIDDGSVVVVIADVAGKGVGASLTMASVKAVLPFVARTSVSEAMATLNAKLAKELGKREFVALAYARFVPADGTLQIANAGMPDPYLVTSAGEVRPLVVDGTRLPLGIRADVMYDVLTATLAPGDRVVFVSDGLPEATAQGEPLGYDELQRIVGETGGDLDALFAAISALVREEREDDWTAVVLAR